MASHPSRNLASAITDFQRARARARIEQIMGLLTGESTDLLCYEDVRRKLRGTGAVSRGVQNIPLDAIIGSVGRCSDFTRTFLPRQDESQSRWARVELAMTDMVGLPPIEVYQIGDTYFVQDGNHRVSVAREMGATHIEAYVTEVKTRVPLSPDDEPDDLIVKAQQAEFLDRTKLDVLRPDADLSVSVPGQYQKLEEHISVHRYYMGIEQDREIPYEEAVAHWYDAVYLPVVQAIRERGTLRDFPDRTEADLYLWLSEHRAALQQELGWEIKAETAAGDMAARFSPRLKRILSRLRDRVLDILIPDKIAPGPAPGAWRRQQREVDAQQAHLFEDTLVVVTGQEGGWNAVEQAIGIAGRENGRLLGLHVASSQAVARGDAVQAIRAGFEQRCEATGVSGRLVVGVGEVAARICERSRWTDLVVVPLAHPPGDQPRARLGSGFRKLVACSLSPLLAVPGNPSSLQRMLLAYDGSPKAEEALYICAYLAGAWGVSLTVVTVTEKERTTPKTVGRAQAYLEERRVQAEFVEQRGPVGETILRAAEAQGCDLIVMGGYGSGPLLQIVLGSAVDQVLRESRHPVLVCQ